jgi:hypothetical protein
MASQQPPAPNDGDDYQQQQQEQQDAERNPYASSSRWRHGESTAYARYEKDRGQPARPHHHHHHAVAREADSRGGGVSDLADFLNKSRIDPSEIRADATSRPHTPRFKPVVAGASEARVATAHAQDGPGHGAEVAAAPPADGKEIVCGPLLNYRRMEGTTWIGSVLVVTAGGGRTQPIVPTLDLRRVGGGKEGGEKTGIEGTCLYSDARNTFWRFNLAVEMEEAETSWEYELPGMHFASRTKPRVNKFFVPALDESMRIMFHSCNGFSVGTDEAAWSGPALWNDVLRKHQERPFHVMYDAVVFVIWRCRADGVAGLVAAIRSTTTASGSRARCGRGRTLPTPRSGRTTRSRRACGRSAMTTT